ncbi:hypothetical protein KKE19_00065 [Patescibacteria group bacterium]|nr:hypothetical protein [Patescibacteria group bacterium]MBU4367300.1 hypothetical protein [Patescibacteria group bacterium]MBU4461637.1 hypothetical protein [Patescibacteria group bacterium]MCG2699687.1 hypothetical protein [Candidatus Parcubacteria bacterium]
MKRERKEKKDLKGGGPEGDSFQDITPDVIKVPEPPPVDALPKVVDMAATEEMDQKLEQSADQVNQWVTTASTWLANYDGSNQAKRDRFANEAKKYRKTLAGLLNHENTTIRRAAWLALFLSRFSQTYTSHAGVALLLADMVKQKQLVVETTGEGSISAQLKQYNFSLDASFEENHIIQIQQAFRAMLTRVWAAVREGWRIKKEELVQMGTTNLDDLVIGKPGNYVIDVPSQEPKGDEREKSFRLEGGRLVVHSDGEKITVIDVCNELHGWGNFERSIREAMDLRPPVFLKVESLSWDKPPFIKDKPEYGRKVRMLWFSIKRAIANAKLGEILPEAEIETSDREQNDKGEETAPENNDTNVVASKSSR